MIKSLLENGIDHIYVSMSFKENFLNLKDIFVQNYKDNNRISLLFLDKKHKHKHKQFDHLEHIYLYRKQY